MSAIESSVGRPVRGHNFFDRHDEQRLLWQRVAQDHVLLLAPRRVGKTSLLLRLLDDAATHGFHAVYLSVADARTELDVTKKIVAALAEHPASDPAWKRLLKGPFKRFFARVRPKLTAGPLSIDILPEEAPTWSSLAETTIEALQGQANERWLLLVDELPIFVLGLLRQDPTGERARVFLNGFRALRNPVARVTPGTDAAPDVPRWIVAGSIGLDAVVARAKLGDTINDMAVVALGAFSREHADRFLLALGDSYNLALDEATRDALLLRAGWLIPYYLQVLFAQLHRLVVDEGLAPSPALVDRVVTELLSPTHRAYFDYWRQRLTEELGRPDDKHALAILAAVAVAPDGSTHAELDTALTPLIAAPEARAEALRFLLDVLENDGYLAREVSLQAGQPAPSGSPPRFRFRSALLREYWVRRVV